MRVGLGLLTILIAVAIILMVSFSGPGGGYVNTVVQKGQNAQSQASQLAGVDDNGMKAQDSIVLEESSSNGKLKSLLVKLIVPTGPMAAVYGLIPGDEIIEIPPQRVRDQTDPELAKDLVYDAYQRNWPLVVLRNGEQLTLNPQGALTKAHPNLFPGPAQQPASASPTSPAGTPAAVQNQLNQIQKIPMH